MGSVLPFGALLVLAAFSDICVAKVVDMEVKMKVGTIKCQILFMSRTLPISKLCDEHQDCMGVHEQERTDYTCTNDCPGEGGKGCINGACLDHYCFCNPGYTGLSCDRTGHTPGTTQTPTTTEVPTTQISTPGGPGASYLECIRGGFGVVLNRSFFEDHFGANVYVKGSHGHCSRDVSEGFSSGLTYHLYLSYQDCGVQDWGNIILVLSNHSALITHQPREYAGICEGKSLTVFERTEWNLETPSISNVSIATLSENTTVATINVEPKELFGGFVKNCNVSLSNDVGVTINGAWYKEGCPTYGGFRTPWHVEPTTQTLQASFDSPPYSYIKIGIMCEVDTCIGGCEKPVCAKPRKPSIPTIPSEPSI